MIKRWQPSPPSLTVPGGGWTVGAKWHLTAIFCIQGYTGHWDLGTEQGAVLKGRYIAG